MATLREVQQKMASMGSYPQSKPRQEGVMTAQQLIEKLIHIPPGSRLGLFEHVGGGCSLEILGEDDAPDGLLWADPFFIDEGESVKESSKEHIAVVESANENEKAVLRVAYQFMKQNQRKGQALMNALRMKAPELYDILTGTDKDPFYSDDKLQVALDELGFKIRRFW